MVNYVQKRQSPLRRPPSSWLPTGSCDRDCQNLPNREQELFCLCTINVWHIFWWRLKWRSHRQVGDVLGTFWTMSVGYTHIYRQQNERIRESQLGFFRSSKSCDLTAELMKKPVAQCCFFFSFFACNIVQLVCFYCITPRDALFVKECCDITWCCPLLL